MRKLVYYWTNGHADRKTSNIEDIQKWVQEEGGMYITAYEEIKTKNDCVPYTENPKSKFYKGEK